MQVRLERDDLRVLLERHVVVELLVRPVGEHVDVDPVAQAWAGARVLGLVIGREELEAELEVARGLTAVGVEVRGPQVQRRVRREQPSGLLGEDVGVPAHLVDRPVRGGPDDLAPVLAEDAARVRHVVEDVAPPHRAAASLHRYVVDLPHLDGLDVAVLGEAGGHEPDVAPAVGPDRGQRDARSDEDQVGLADRPRAVVPEVDRRRQVGGVALRRSVVGPRLDHRQLFVAQRRVVLEVLDADVLLDVERRHGAHAVADRRAVSNAPDAPPHLVVRGEREGSAAPGAVAALAAALKDGRDVLGEGHGRGIDAEIRRVVEVRLVVRDARVVRLRFGEDRGEQERGDREDEASGVHRTLLTRRSGGRGASRGRSQDEPGPRRPQAAAASAYSRSSKSAKATSVVPDAITTCWRPSSRCVIAAAPQMREPVW